MAYRPGPPDWTPHPTKLPTVEEAPPKVPTQPARVPSTTGVTASSSGPYRPPPAAPPAAPPGAVPRGTPPPPGGGAGAAPFTGRKPTPAELRAWAQTQGWSEDFDRFSDAVLAGWIDTSWDVNAQKFRSRRQGVGGLWEKPTECPPGPDGSPMVPSGPNESDPCVPRPAWAGGGGGGGAPGAGGAVGATGAPGGWGLTAEEKNYLTAITNLANTTAAQSQKLFGAGYPAYVSSLEHWKKVSGAYGRGGMEAALGPARETIADAYRGAAAQTRGMRGAEKTQALSELARGEAGDIGRLGAEQQAQAYAGLQQGAEYGVSTGLAGTGQAAGLYAGAESALAQSRLTEEGYGVQQSIAQLQAQTQWKIASLSANVSREQIAAEQGLASQQLAQRAYEFEQTFMLQNQQFQEQMRQFNLSLRAQQQASKNQLIGTGIGAAAGIGVTALFV